MLFTLNCELKTLIDCVRKSSVNRKRCGLGSTVGDHTFAKARKVTVCVTFNRRLNDPWCVSNCFRFGKSVTHKNVYYLWETRRNEKVARKKRFQKLRPTLAPQRAGPCQVGSGELITLVVSTDDNTFCNYVRGPTFVYIFFWIRFLFCCHVQYTDRRLAVQHILH